MKIKIFMILICMIIMVISGCSHEKLTENNKFTEKSNNEKDKSSNLKETDKEQKKRPVYFVSRAEHKAGELYVLKEDGSIQRLTNNNRHENNVAVSFDGTKIVYHGGEEADPLTWEIYIMDLNTLEETQITDNEVIDGHPDWSPDGKHIIYASFIDEKGNPTGMADIYTIHLETNQKKQLTNSPEEDNDPEWSPDGTKIIYKSTEHTKQSGREEIYVMDADGSNKQRLTTVTGWQSDHDPSWNKDSKTITFERFEGQRVWYDIGNPDILINNLNDLTPWNIYTVDLEGHITQLTSVTKGDIAFLPVFSTDNQSILYMHMDFLLKDGVVIGADKKLMLQNTNTLQEKQYMPNNEHRYTLEYFDW